MPPITPGDRAPSFELPATTGIVRLADLTRQGPVVVTFYVEDNTPDCSRQVGSFQAEFETLQELGVQVVAISTDSLEAHRQFEKNLGGLSFPLASDAEMQVARQYGVADEQYKRAQRAVFVVGADGRIVDAIVPYVPANVEQFMQIFEALGLEP